MTSDNLLFTLASCAFFMALVGWISWVKTRGTAETQEGYFLAGRGLVSGIGVGRCLLGPILLILILNLLIWINTALKKGLRRSTHELEPPRPRIVFFSMQKPSKHRYVKPVLRCYGSVRFLTGGSTGPGNDGLGGFSGMGGAGGTGTGMGMGMWM